MNTCCCIERPARAESDVVVCRDVRLIDDKKRRVNHRNSRHHPTSGLRLTLDLRQSSSSSQHMMEANGHAPSSLSITSDANNAVDSAKAAGHPAHQDGFPLVQRFHNSRSILALAVYGNYLYAGTQGGDILVYSLQTFECIRTIAAHHGAVLGFCLSQDGSFLFSSAGDRFVNIWSTETLEHQASIYSVYDVGDIFCVSYSSRLKKLYLGCQNTSIQWIEYRGDIADRPPNPRSHPSFREDRFFDSLGPGGVRTPRSDQSHQRRLNHRPDRDFEIGKDDLHQFAHYGYVFAMMLVSGQLLGVPNQEVLISGGGDGLVKIWTVREVDNGKPEQLYILNDGKDEGNSVLSLSLDRTFLYCGRADGQVNIWDLETRQLVRSFRSHRDEILALSVVQGSLFSASTDGTIKSFTQRQEPLRHWKAHSGRVLASAQTQFRGQNLYFTGGNDDTIAVWDVSTVGAPGALVSHVNTDNKMIETLQAFIAHRTVSSDVKYKADCRRGASYLRALFKSFGATTALLRTEEDYNPVVLARFHAHGLPDQKKPSILFYGHYDVIAAENKQKKWRSDPFTLTGADGYLYGRGITDNKGPIIAAVFAAAELAASSQLQSDVVFLIEGEEECGSRGFQAAVQQNRELIGPVDWILLANSYWLDDELPCLTYGLRGVLHATVEVESDEPDLHSGVDGSSLLDEPLKDLTYLISTLTGPKRRVQIPGFYERIPDMTSDERHLYEEITQYLLRFNPSLSTPEGLTESIIKRTRDPSLTIHGFRTSGSEKSTIIPQFASAALSIRLVPNQEVDEIAASLTSYLEAQFSRSESKNHLRVQINHRAEPWVADYRNKIFKTLERAVTDVWAQSADPRQRRSSATAAQSMSPSLNPKNKMPAPTSLNIAAATSPTSPTTSPSRATNPSIEELSKMRLGEPIMTTASISSAATTAAQARRPATSDSSDSNSTSATSPVAGRKPLYVREGGSIPAVRFLEKEFDAPAAHLPCGQASDHAHLDNERFRILNLLNSREIFRRVFAELPASS